MRAELLLTQREAPAQLHALSTTAPMLVYLLHVSRPCGHATHYVGSTARHRLRKRMQAHANGYGSAFTREVVDDGASLSLALLLPASSRWLETLMLRSFDAERACCFCNPRLRAPEYAGVLPQTTAPPGVARPWEALTF